MRLHDVFLSFVLVVLPTPSCHRSAATAAAAGAERTAPAPFTSPPVLASTPDIATLVAKVKPAVVNITAVHEVKVPRPNLDFPGFGDFGGLRRFFDQRSGRPPSRGQTEPGHPRGDDQSRGDDQGTDDQGNDDEESLRQQALGSGFLFDSAGHVVTNAHVVDEAEIVRVTLSDDREFRARVVGKDQRLDVAVLQLQGAPHDIPQVSLGSSDALRVGEYVVAIGNPFGLGDTVTMGIVSAKGRTIGAGPYDDFIQTDASINPGNSGGPLFDLHGQVVGINTAISAEGKGIGFAIPIDAVRHILPQLIATGHVTRGRIGALIQGMDADLARALGLDRPRGALVEEVQPGSPAEKAGVRAGDVITAVDGAAVSHASDLPRMIAGHPPGAVVKLDVLRDGRTRNIDVTLAPLSSEPHASATPTREESQSEASPIFGVTLRDQDGQAVVEHVDPGGPADGKLRPGDVIEDVDRHAVKGASDASSRLRNAAAGRPVLVRIKRGDQSQYVALERTP